MKISVILIFSLLLILGCGDLIIMKKRVIGNYYLVKGDTQMDLSLSYKTNDVFVERVPGRVIRYGYSDSFLVAERVDYLGNHSFYIINMLKDGDTARNKVTFLNGPLSEDEYKKSWESRLNLQLESIK